MRAPSYACYVLKNSMRKARTEINGAVGNIEAASVLVHIYVTSVVCGMAHWH